MNHFLDNAKDLDLLGSAVTTLLLDDMSINLLEGTGMTDSALVVDVCFHD